MAHLLATICPLKGTVQAHETLGSANGSWLVVSNPTDQAQLHGRNISMVYISMYLLHVTGSDRKWILGHGISQSQLQLESAAMRSQ